MKLGGLSNPARLEKPSDAIFASVLGVIQARGSVADAIEINRLFVDASAAGAAGNSESWERKRDGRGIPSRERATRAYREAWSIYQACFPSRIRDEFEAVLGAPFGEFENAVQSLGWILATPAAQVRACNSPAAILTPEDLADE